MSLPPLQILTPNSPPNEQPTHSTTIFLAGPTEVPWRDVFLTLLTSAVAAAAAAANPANATLPPPHGLTIYNPFQPNWDSTWREDYATDPKFRAQTDWEMDRMDAATVVVFYFDERSKAPVSLLELGLVARSGRVVVGCQPGFWKRGNVQAVCERLGVPLEEDMDALVQRVVERVKG